MQPVIDWLLSLMRTIGAPGVGVATALETVFPPVPSEVVLPLAGFVAWQGAYGVVAAIVWATVGSLVGAYLLYWAGAAWGVDRVRRVAGRLPLVDEHDVDRAMDAFGRHGRSAVLVGRVVPGVRSVISIPAGVDRMPLLTFTLWTVVGSAAWNGLLVGGGYLLGTRWHLVEKYTGVVSNVVYVLLAVLVVWFVVRRLRRRSAGRRG